MALEIELSNPAARRLARSPRDLQGRLLRKIRELAENPMMKGAAPLKGFPDLFRVAVGGWRIIYSWDRTHLQIHEIATRGQVYKDMIGR